MATSKIELLPHLHELCCSCCSTCCDCEQRTGRACRPGSCAATATEPCRWRQTPTAGFGRRAAPAGTSSRRPHTDPAPWAIAIGTTSGGGLAAVVQYVVVTGAAPTDEFGHTAIYGLERDLHRTSASSSLYQRVCTMRARMLDLDDPRRIAWELPAGLRTKHVGHRGNSKELVRTEGSFVAEAHMPFVLLRSIWSFRRQLQELATANPACCPPRCQPSVSCSAGHLATCRLLLLWSICRDASPQLTAVRTNTKQRQSGL